ncbi:MAG: MmgE/PrpD family protein [Betaproteobacteria bacterium RIFCSPLOWO2_02_FULL_67_26]|nr:MAG: MmgE/PrpD family protein [Betaproteobacteria bacterium RIFCSPLOWO2_02_FULL_67_26]
MTTITRELAGFVARTSYEALPAEVRSRAKAFALDLVGIALRARNEAESTPAMVNAAARLGLTGGACTVIGDAAGYAPPGAAMLNGTLAHSLDFDDTHASGSLHPSAPIAPAAFAAAEMTGADGKAVIAAIVAGYEVQIRLALALDPAAHYDRGFHPTATCGAFGAAAAAGRLLGLDADGHANAFGIVLSMSAGSLQFLVNGAWTKRSHVGHAAMCGLVAATLAREGYKGASEAIEGKWGFLHAYAPAADAAKVVDGLGSRWETLKIAVKPYPSCRYGHASIDGILDLARAHRIQAGEVEEVMVGLPEPGWKLIGDPEAAKQSPNNVVDGQFSMAFCASVALRSGGFAWDDYARYLGDPGVLALCKKVRTRVDPEVQAGFPAEMGGRVAIRTGRGTFEAHVRVPKGEPANFLSAAELRAKFDGLAGPYLSARRRDELAGAILALEQAKDIGAVLRLTRPEDARGRRAAALSA